MYQFIHIETYARKASTKIKPTKSKKPQSEKTRRDVGGVLGEAMRDIGYCDHVENPQAPTFLYGDEDKLRSIPARIELNIEAYQKKHGGKKLRSDAHVLLAGVASYPRQLEQSNPARYAEWKAMTLAYLQKTCGDKLVCVLEHQDEKEPHLHFYVLSDDEPNVKKLHAGYVAASAHPALSQAGKDAYKDAMRAFQSEFYEDVGHPCGLLRDGPKRVRMPTGEYKALQRATNERYEQDQRLKLSQENKTNSIRLQLETNTAFMRDQRAQLKIERKQLQADYENLEKLRVAVSKKATELDAILKDVSIVKSMQTLAGLGLVDELPATTPDGDFKL